MNTVKILLASIALIFLNSFQTYSQDGRIDFDRFIIGNYYKVILENEQEFTGKLLKVDDFYIEMLTETKTIRIKKINIAGMEKSHSIIHMLSKNDSLYKADNSLKTIILKDGSEMIGYIKGIDSAKLKFETVSGVKLDIMKEQIEEIIDERKDYKIGQDPNRSRLFLSPTGRNLKAGTGYFSVNELLFPIIAFGLHDYVTIAGGMSLLPGSESQLLYFNGKVGLYQSENINLSAGYLYTNFTSDDGEGLSLLFGNGTFGNDAASLTLSLGLTMSGEDPGKYPMLIIGGEAKISNSVKLISENWIPTSPNSTYMLSFGVRFFGKRIAGDFGLILPIDSNGEPMSGFPFFPWLGFNYNFDL